MIGDKIHENTKQEKNDNAVTTNFELGKNETYTQHSHLDPLGSYHPVLVQILYELGIGIA